MSKGRILSGMRPTGRLHIGHLSVLENWRRLQKEYQCHFMVADWHAITTKIEETESIRSNVRELVIDWLSVGIDPEESVVFVQSQVKEHAELHLLFSMITPIGWLERCPTYKDQVQQLGEQGKDINTYGFLGYPVLQAADILVYKADTVPVGEDQIPHVELTREIGRRFNFLYQTKIFPEPKTLLAEVSLLPGVDGRKMSKSYNNEIAISATTEEIQSRVNAMITDPARVRKTDPGNPEVCVVYTYQKLYNPGETAEIAEGCRTAQIGCVACKKKLTAVIDGFLSPFREKRQQLLANPGQVDEILATGAEKARKVAQATLAEVREAVKI
ncbi:MAG: tryptophan--tRNA ligase [Clostridia bacterium]|nr:tryptophan--tRNA ligase [Clostridia bacterium]